MAAHYETFALSSDHWTHCFGFDNSFYYLLFIPTLLRALHSQAKLPDTIVSNEFLLLEGQKFSTSRNHAIWADEFSGNAEHLRLFLCLHRPSTENANFSELAFRSFSLDLGKQLATVQTRASKNKEVFNAEALMDCNRFTREMEYFLSPAVFDLRSASRRLLEFLDRILSSAQAGGALRMHTLAVVMAPFLPGESQKLLKNLGIERAEWLTDWTRAL